VRSAILSGVKAEDRLIGFNATISAPHMHASACENLLPFLGRGKRVLDVGSGSGYRRYLCGLVKLTVVTAVLHHLCPGGLVLGIDHLSGLVQLGRRNLEQDGVTLGLSDLTGVDVMLGDGRKGESAKGKNA
jgi:protein-L-isoaspartate(D-aspartate) O-methyltransferase